jgi:hypothetical protein
VIHLIDLLVWNSNPIQDLEATFVSRRQLIAIKSHFVANCVPDARKGDFPETGKAI